ncbi:MAG: selenoneine synthase SenA [Thiobacillus sp.]
MNSSRIYNMPTPLSRPVSPYTAAQLIAKLAHAREQLRALIQCLPDAGWLGPRAAHLNPPLWEYGHIAWFQERWCLRARPDGLYAPSLLADADALYDSSAVPHDTRWGLPLLDTSAVDDYARRIADAIATRLRSELDNDLAYYAELCLYHELMHIEAWWMAFQDLGYGPPRPLVLPLNPASPPLAFAESEVALGSTPDEGFIFDNEKWRHNVHIGAFDIDAAPMRQRDFMAFVESGGYQQRSGWSEAGWSWREANQITHPVYWRKQNGGWQVRSFDQWQPLNPDATMLHVNHFEAEAYAAWLGRQLPTAAQWVRASQSPDFFWGQAWEWLREPFSPYPGFAPDPYEDYAQPWFHSHWELRGGGPVTDPQLKRVGFRNFYLPHRRDAFSGFRTASR